MESANRDSRLSARQSRQTHYQLITHLEAEKTRATQAYFSVVGYVLACVGRDVISSPLASHTAATANIHEHLSHQPHCYSSILMGVACCLAFLASTCEWVYRHLYDKYYHISMEEILIDTRVIILLYFALCCQHKGSLFILEDGRHLHVTTAFDSMLTKLQIDSQRYSTHCLGQPLQQDRPMLHTLSSNWCEDGRAMAYLTYIKNSPN